MSAPAIHLSDVASVRIQRKVYSKWNNLELSGKSKDGTTLFWLSLTGEMFDAGHLPLPVIWEMPEFTQKAEEYRDMTTARELFSLRLQNQPEDPRLTEIRALVNAWRSLTLDADTLAVAISEVLSGHPEPDCLEVAPAANDAVAPANGQGEPKAWVDPIPDDEIRF
jgi:hypothetical protein